MSAWGHKIEQITVGTMTRGGNDPAGQTCSNGLRCPGKRKYPERGLVNTYGAPATHYASYSYVTGRQGRVSWRDLYFCDECAEKWRKKNIKQEAATI